jgi:hypothetical protein
MSLNAVLTCSDSSWTSPGVVWSLSLLAPVWLPDEVSVTNVLRAVAELPTPGPRWGQSTVEGHFSSQKWGGRASKAIVSDAPWRSFSRRFDSATARFT